MSGIIKNLDRKEIEQMVHGDTAFSHGLIHDVISSFFKNLREGVALKEYAELDELGSFHIKRHAAHAGKDPQGHAFSVGERVSIEFNAFEPFREEVSATTGLTCIP